VCRKLNSVPFHWICLWLVYSHKHKQSRTSKAEDDENSNEGSHMPQTPGPLYELRSIEIYSRTSGSGGTKRECCLWTNNCKIIHTETESYFIIYSNHNILFYDVLKMCVCTCDDLVSHAFLTFCVVCETSDDFSDLELDY
jgi:hypothetical protein